MTARLTGFVIISQRAQQDRQADSPPQFRNLLIPTPSHVRRLLLHSFPNPTINGDTGLLSSRTDKENSPSSCLLSERECRNEGTEAVQPKRGQARQCDGVREHRASSTLLYEDGADREEGVRFRLLSALLPPNCRSRSNTQRKGLVPALGSLNTHTKGNPSLSSLPELRLPPSPVLPAQPLPSITPHVKTFEVDPENLRPGVTQDLSVVEDVWRLSADDNAKAPDPSLLTVHGHSPSGSAGGGFDVLHALKVTTHAIRSVRNYLLSLPDEQGISRSQPRQSFRPASLSTSEPQKRRVSLDAARTDPLARIRRAALDVLTVLRELEESARIPLSDDAYDVGSDRSSPSRVLSPTELSDVPTDASFSVSVMRVGGRRESILVWDEEEDDFNVDEEDERVPRERWDERLVLGSGWLYKQDLKIEQLGKQQDAVAQYLDTVDEVLFFGAKGGVRGWTSEKERVEKLEREARGKVRKSSVPFPEMDSVASESTTEAVGSGDSPRRVASVNTLDTLQDLSITEEPEALQTLAEEEHDHDDIPSVDDNDLPRWAQRSAFSDGELSRTHALLIALLPTSLLPHLPTSPDQAELLNALSSGQLLCVAYNIGVRQSRKPWDTSTTSRSTI